MKPKLRDFRDKGMFLMDDEYMNGYAKLCGWKATITYNSICRHANKDQYAFPSVQLIAEENNVSRDTIMEGVKTLEEWNIIKVTKFRTKQGTFKNNGYDLLDKSEWKPKPIANLVADSNMDQVATVDMDLVADSNMDRHVTKSTTATYKDTHIIKDTHILKDNNISINHTNTKPNGFGKPELNKGMEFLLELRGKPINKVALNRFALNRLVKKHGLDRSCRALKFAFSVVEDEFAPAITDYISLERKWENLEIYARRKMKKANAADIQGSIERGKQIGDIT